MKDVALKIPDDLKSWYAISSPTKGLRFDARTLELLDADGDGRIRTEEILSALAFLKSRGVAPEALFESDPQAESQLDGVLGKLAALDRAEPTAADREALAAWEQEGLKPEVAVLGEKTAEAEAALAAVEPVLDEFFTPPADLPLVTDEPDRELPLKDHLNPKYLEAVLDFAAKCVTPVLGADCNSLSRLAYKRVKGAFAPYRAWRAAKPVASAPEKASLVEEERFWRYRLHLGEFLRNFVTMDGLYSGRGSAIFQTGVLRIDGKELSLCFHVESEGAHSALSGKSSCCVIYLKLTRPAEAAERQVCAVVTAGTVIGLYVGRNGVFYDRDGKNWEAVVTKVVEAQVSLAEAFWAPWRKLGEGIAATVKKFLGARQEKATAALPTPKEGGAALASSIAAIGIGVGMVGAAAASVLAAVKGMGPCRLALSVVALVLVVSLPSVILTWFKLRRRDLGAILNASGWAINRPMRFSTSRAREFTKCAPTAGAGLVLFLLAALVLAVGGFSWYHFKKTSCAAASAAPASEVKNAQN